MGQPRLIDDHVAGLRVLIVCIELNCYQLSPLGQAFREVLALAVRDRSTNSFGFVQTEPKKKRSVFGPCTVQHRQLCVTCTSLLDSIAIN
jgi:hypothetical protein